MLRKYGLILCLSLSGARLFAQGQPLSISDALKRLEQTYPLLQSAKSQIHASESVIDLTKNTLMPDIRAGYQVNLATFNNITGMSYPGFLLPVSGPPSVKNDGRMVTGSAMGLLLTWSPISFGTRPAAIQKAKADVAEATANYDQQLFQVKCHLLDIYLQAQYYRQVLKQAGASIERNMVEKAAVEVLVRNGLKAGIDSAELNTKLMRSIIDSIQINQQYLATLTELKWMTGIDVPTNRIVLTDSNFSMTKLSLPDTGFTGQHPYFHFLLSKRNSSVAALQQVSHSWVPQLDIWSNLYTRGSGIDAGGQVHTWDGLGFSRTNAGIGVQLSFPILQFSRLTIQKKQYRFLVQSDEAQLAQARLDLGKQKDDAYTSYLQNLKIAGNTNQLVASARKVYEGVRISYATGLSDYVRLATAETALYQSEINRINAQIQVWRSLLFLASAKGDLRLFTDQLP